MGSGIGLSVDGEDVEIDPGERTLLDVLRHELGKTSVKDGCSPQGQCGCCTVLVDGQPRVSCVTPARRMAGRTVTTVDGLDANVKTAWAESFCATGGSQCGFCTPGIILRLEGLRQKSGDAAGPAAIDRALAAHLCRCTGWNTVREAYVGFGSARLADRDLEAASRRAAIETGGVQRVAPSVALGAGGFADDLPPADALVAVSDGTGGWVVADTMPEARLAAGKVQGRRTTATARPPLEVPEGAWDATLRTSWVEPGYLETDASWCLPGGDPASPLANGGAFGGKVDSDVGIVARRLADRHGRPVRVLLSREDTVRRGPKRPPFAGGANADGTGSVRVASTPGIAQSVASVAPGLRVVEVDVTGPPTSVALRAAGWAEALALLAGAAGAPTPVVDPVSGARAEASYDPASDRIDVLVRAGAPLDEVVLRSYCIGAAHMAWSWVMSESLTVDDEGEVHDLTIRSFGIAKASETPHVAVTVEGDDGEPVRGGDAVFAAAAQAVWAAASWSQDWPVR